ncbi:MAG: SUMF1/EgtB/PvdO family nonheme iron enzyme, partial [Legionella sp.]|nr:SUMF1/EgtB/PvdO family nonheme iron enzyme [Legionella sp.]
MKNARYMMFAYTLMFILILSACAAPPTAETVIVVVTATDVPPTETPTAEPTPALAPVALAGPKSGDKMKWVDGSVLVYVPAGDFMMGDGIYALAHSVSLDGYWIQQTKVTNRMYEQCVKVGSCTAPKQE